MISGRHARVTIRWEPRPKRARKPRQPDWSRVVDASASVDLAAHRVTFRVEHELETTNRGMWGGHWRVKYRETKRWERLFARCLLPTEVQALMVKNTRMRVDVRRLVPSRRRFTRDEENLRMSTKPLLDALKRLGLIYDDSRVWLDCPLPVQDVSGDGQCWTLITVEPGA